MFSHTCSISVPHRQRHKLRRVAIVGLVSILACQASHASVLNFFFGWGYSKYAAYKKVKAYVGAGGTVLSLAPPTAPIGGPVQMVVVAADFLDPPSSNAIISGRATIDYDPTYQTLGAGWFGEFGNDPELAAPPVNVSPLDSGVDLLQEQNNPAMASASITTTPGRTVFNFDWGSTGFVPTANLDAAGHFNFAALYVYSPTFSDKIPGASADNVFQTVGTAADAVAMGTNAPTYMMCTNGLCGVKPIPEPASPLTMLAGLGCIAFARRWRRPI